jgi:hypothetical protein
MQHKKPRKLRKDTIKTESSLSITETAVKVKHSAPHNYSLLISIIGVLIAFTSIVLVTCNYKLTRYIVYKRDKPEISLRAFGNDLGSELIYDQDQMQMFLRVGAELRNTGNRGAICGEFTIPAGSMFWGQLNRLSVSKDDEPAPALLLMVLQRHMLIENKPIIITLDGEVHTSLTVPANSVVDVVLVYDFGTTGRWGGHIFRRGFWDTPFPYDDKLSFMDKPGEWVDADPKEYYMSLFQPVDVKITYSVNDEMESYNLQTEDIYLVDRRKWPMPAPTAKELEQMNKEDLEAMVKVLIEAIDEDKRKREVK